jgi:hypothetical protein
MLLDPDPQSCIEYQTPIRATPLLTRSQSQGNTRTHSAPISPTKQQPQQPVYILTADGSSLFLLDSSKPNRLEQPPPYITAHLPHTGPDPSASSSPSAAARASPTTATLRNAPLPRHRASTVSSSSPIAPRPRYHSYASQGALSPSRRGTISTGSSPSHRVVGVVDETTPLLSVHPQLLSESVAIDQAALRLFKRRFWRGVFCGELEDGEGRDWKAGWRRYWAPVGRKVYWMVVLHLGLLNFPFVSGWRYTPSVKYLEGKTVDAPGALLVATAHRRYTCRHHSAHYSTPWYGRLVVDLVSDQMGSTTRGEW